MANKVEVRYKNDSDHASSATMEIKMEGKMRRRIEREEKFGLLKV